MKTKSGFTLVEILVAMAVFGFFSAALLGPWTALQTSAVNTTAYAARQNDQMRAMDYVKRDVRRASAVDIYSGGALVTGSTFGSELRLTIPDYYTDSREEDNAIGASTPATPSLSGTNVTYGSALTVRYYVTNGALIRTTLNLVGWENKGCRLDSKLHDYGTNFGNPEENAQRYSNLTFSITLAPPAMVTAASASGICATSEISESLASACI